MGKVQHHLLISDDRHYLLGTLRVQVALKKATFYDCLIPQPPQNYARYVCGVDMTTALTARCANSVSDLSAAVLPFMDCRLPTNGRRRRHPLTVTQTRQSCAFARIPFSSGQPARTQLIICGGDGGRRLHYEVLNSVV